MRDSTVAAAIGAVITLPDTEYETGIGQLQLRIEGIEILRVRSGWAVLRGVQLGHQGQELRPREVTVPIDALVRALPDSYDE